MANTENSVIIDSGKVIIDDQNRPARIGIYWAMAIFGVQAVFFALKFQNSGEFYYLVLTGFLSFLPGLLVSREIFFRTYRRELNINQIHRVKIRKVLFGKGNVYLEFRLGRKTREVFIDRHRAAQIKAELDPLS